MSGTYTNSNTNTYTEARARYVFGKLKDDFMNLAYRGFTKVTNAQILGWWEDVAYLAEKKALEKCQLRFQWAGFERAINYQVISDGSIHLDSTSAAFDFYQVPKEASVSITIQRGHTNPTINEYMRKRGWVSGAGFLEGDQRASGGYSKDGYGLNISTIGF